MKLNIGSIEYVDMGKKAKWFLVEIYVFLTVM